MSLYWVNQTTDASGPLRLWSKGSPEYASVQVSGTFDGALLTLAISQDGLPEHVLDSYSATAEGITTLIIPAGSSYRFILQNSGASTNISVSIMGGGV